MWTSSQPEPESITTRFGETHRKLSRLFTKIAGDLRAGDCAAARDGWRTLDRELSAHMAFEEREMLPLFAKVDGAAAAELRADHADFRQMLDDLGTAIDLKRLSAPNAEQFFDRLEKHAAREDELLYRWADEQPARRRSFLSVLEREQMSAG